MCNSSLPAAYIHPQDKLNVIATLLETMEYLFSDPKSQDIAFALLEYARDLAKSRQDLEEVTL
ncbi:hypothetical protein QE197_09655 [Arsenophonus nasoniae]|nr:hypothetical protein [Arsenophonus nasoniae]QBY42620.1 hypothetical protein ArsFIN_11780 [Arsenophonus nasoniae]QBY43712.1 hypothetical protein ArsFIN_22800 [Arsenophonus nasoniae]WGM06712.1 hypothetical protein QE258_05235 [Arsenophonus nasoniae]WGM11657.1 hypothetical protein QE197_04785 [Arsenophonus nasoniae]WGM12500.1 hypothetical protein QE197_09655 [Arsenophonus nasoniae]